VSVPADSDRPLTSADEADFELAAQLVRAAGQLAAQMREGGIAAQRKTSVSDLVTAADHAAEKLIVDRLRLERPSDGIVGEEGTTHPGTRTWFLDPVDGTYNYAFGLPTWCTALALRGPQGLILGAIYQPSTDELWLGGPGHPTTCNSVPVARLTDQCLDQLSVATYLHPTTLPDASVREPLLAVMQAAATVRMLGSGSIELASISAGRLGVYAQVNCLDWDWFPGQALIEAAGGVTSVLHRNGHRWHLAGNGQAVAQLSALLS
jgi:myo-inositol-1(or 4)-monophosphatase